MLTAEKTDRYFIPTVERMMRLLEYVQHADTELSVKEIADQTRIPYTTTLRLLYTLTHSGWLQRTDNGYAMKPGRRRTDDRRIQMGICMQNRHAGGPCGIEHLHETEKKAQFALA